MYAFLLILACGYRRGWGRAYWSGPAVRRTGLRRLDRHARCGLIVGGSHSHRLLRCGSRRWTHRKSARRTAVARIRLSEEAVAAVTEEPADAAPARIPFPPKPVAEPAAPPAPAVATPRVLPEDAALERLREKFPTLVRLENAPVVEDAEVSLSPKPSVRADEAVAEANNAVAQQTNGATPPRIEPRLEVQARPASRPERAKNFEAFWPKKQRPGQEAPAPAAKQPAAQQHSRSSRS